MIYPYEPHIWHNMTMDGAEQDHLQGMRGWQYEASSLKHKPSISSTEADAWSLNQYLDKSDRSPSRVLFT